VSQPVYERTVGSLGVDAGAAEGTQHPVLQGAAGDSVAVGADEQRRGDRPGAQSPGGGAALGGGRKAPNPSVEGTCPHVPEAEYSVELSAYRR
jgi:hypothetical protein